MGAVQFLVLNWRFQMFIMPAAPNQLSDPTYLSIVCKYAFAEACVHFGSNFCGALL